MLDLWIKLKIALEVFRRCSSMTIRLFMARAVYFWLVGAMNAFALSAKVAIRQANWKSRYSLRDASTPVRKPTYREHFLSAQQFPFILIL
jgi:hypothetical protein